MWPTSRARLGSISRRILEVEPLEDRTLLDGSVPIQPGQTVQGRISQVGEIDRYSFTIDPLTAIYLRTRVEANGFQSRLSLDGPDGGLLVQSDGLATTNPDDQIVQYLMQGNYTLEVQGVGGGTGDYTLVTSFQPAAMFGFGQDYSSST